MKIILSPAERLRVERDFLEPESAPRFLEQAETLRDALRAAARVTGAAVR